MAHIEANPLKTGLPPCVWVVIYIIPFIFVLDVAFILQGSWHQSAQVFCRSGPRVWLICAGLQVIWPA